jgi:hypothetical protein
LESNNCFSKSICSSSSAHATSIQLL